MGLKDETVFSKHVIVPQVQKPVRARQVRGQLPSLSDAYVDDMFDATKRRLSKPLLKRIPKPAKRP